MKTKHTAGNWKVTDDFIGVWAEIGDKVVKVCGLDSEEAPDVSYDESLANAKLIAASPELLEAAILAVRELSGFFSNGESQALEELKSAINKATA